MKRLLLVAVIASSGQRAYAEAPRLRLDHEPAPRHLHMRPRTRTAAKPAAPSAPLPAAPAPSATTFKPSDDAVGLVRDLRRPISASLSMGYVVDGTALTDKRTLDGRTVRVAGNYIPETMQMSKVDDFRRLRAYAVGEGTFSSRGVLLPSLSTYFATGFQLAKPQLERDPTVNGNRVIAPPIATWFDRSGFQGRSAWLEVKDFVGDKRYAPLRVRAGQLYVYGPWVLHMYGVVAGWDGKLFKLDAYGGSRVPDYTLVDVLPKDRSGIIGGSARIDLRELKSKLPIAAAIELLQFTERGGPDDLASQHGMVQLDWRPRQDIALIGQARWLDQKLANQHLQLRSRYKQVTNLVFDVTYRSDKDWRWDPAVPTNDPLAPKRYLDLGPVVPQLIASARAGTLIKENVDVLVRGAVASERVDSDAERSTFAASYAELGGGFEVRLRRTVALGVTGLTRQTTRYATVANQIVDEPQTTQPLPRPYSPATGERGFTELGASLRMSLGARRFSASAEGYGRRTRYALLYCDGAFDPTCQSATDTGVLADSFRWGGRVTVDAWIGSRLRMFASYELSSRIDFSPEISGYKSLRLMMEGVY